MRRGGERVACAAPDGRPGRTPPEPRFPASRRPGRLLAALVAAGCLAGCGTARHPLTIVVRSAPLGPVEQAAVAENQVHWGDGDPADDDACTESFAALELRRFLAPCLGRPESTIVVSGRGELPATGDVIVIGSARSNPAIAALDRGGPALSPASPDAFRHRLLRANGRRIWCVEGASRTGSLYGAYALLDRMGVRFFDPGPDGTVLPARRARLPERFAADEVPGFATRGFWAWEPRGGPEFFLWMARNRLNFWTAAEHDLPRLRKLGMRLVAGGHMIQKWALDPDVYFRAHPEWYGLVNGRRSRNLGLEAGDNFCTSNPAARGMLAHNVITMLASGVWREADQLAFWMLDNGHWCECGRCAAIGTPTDRLLDLSGVLLDSLRAARRDGRITRPVKVSSLAFLETLPPPTRPLPPGFDREHFTMTFFPIDRCYAHPLADPACSHINHDIAGTLTDWTEARRYDGAMEIGEYYNIDTFKSLPIVLAHVIATDVPWYRRHGARDFHFMHVLTQRWGTWALNHWLLARLLWQPEADSGALMREYFTRRYPGTHARMERVYANLEIAFANAKLLTHRVRLHGHDARFQMTSQLRNSGPVFPLDHLHEDRYHPAANDGPDLADIDAAMAAVRIDLAAARAACRDPAERARLAEDAARIDYGDATLAFYSALLRLHERHIAGRRDLAREFWPALEAAATRLRAIRDMTQGAGPHADAPDGFQATRLAEFYERYRAFYGAGGAPAR